MTTFFPGKLGFFCHWEPHQISPCQRSLNVFSLPFHNIGDEFLELWGVSELSSREILCGVSPNLCV